MRTITRRTWGLLAAAVSALALAGVLAVMSSGEAAAVAPPEPVELILEGCDDTNCRSFPIAKGAGYDTTNLRVTDVDGDPAGRARCSCLFAKNSGWICSLVVSLRDGDHTASGTVTATGLFRPLVEGGPSNSYAITGGTGAYTGATGVVTEGFDSDRDAFVLTLHLQA